MTLTFYSYALNQIEAPLLRLPGEIRNRIYADLLGGLIFSSTTTPRLPWAACVRIRMVECYHEFSNGSPPATLDLSILQTCRQIYDETRLLAFTLNTFTIDPANLTHFINDLTEVQRNAIHTFRVGNSVVSYADGESVATPLFTKMLQDFRPATKTPENLISEWSGIYNLTQLRGLRCLLIGNAYHGSIWEWAPAQRDRLVTMLRVYLQSPSAGIIFEEPRIDSRSLTERQNDLCAAF